MIAQTKVIILAQAVVLVEKAVDVVPPGPDDVVKERWHSTTYKLGEPRSIDKSSTVEMEVESIPNELDWDKAALNQMLAMVFPSGEIMLAYGWITTCANGVTVHLSNFNSWRGREEGPTVIPAPSSEDADGDNE